ncbi:MAG: hypothetical protein R3F37_16820 [Candidatus Competibacteraceae bacterium]
MKGNGKRVGAVAFLLGLFLLIPAQAHQFAPSLLEMREVGRTG